MRTFKKILATLAAYLWLLIGVVVVLVPIIWMGRCGFLKRHIAQRRFSVSGSIQVLLRTLQISVYLHVDLFSNHGRLSGSFLKNLIDCGSLTRSALSSLGSSPVSSLPV